MNRELEGLIRAYDAAGESTGLEAPQQWIVFDRLLGNALMQRPALSRETLLNLIRIAHCRWVRSQEKPSTLPPTA